MNCPIRGVPDSVPVWRKDGLRIEECAGCGVLFTVGRPQESALMQLYQGNALLRHRPGPQPRGEDSFPQWKL